MTRADGVPDRIIGIVGTGTEVGKTWTATQLATMARRDGQRVVARKPAQSFAPADGTATDAHLLASATGEPPHDVCPPHRWYAQALAPPMAADALGLPAFTVADLLDEIRWPEGHVDLALVETAGALRSPVADDGDCLELVTRLDPDVVLLVADAGLGTIGAVRSAMAALVSSSLAARCVVLLNRFDQANDLHVRNATWLADKDGYDVATRVSDVARVVRTPPG